MDSAASSSSSTGNSCPSRSRKARITYTSTDPHEILQSNRTVASPFHINKTRKDAARNWDIFYKNNASGFFKDRHWTDREFSALSQLEEGMQGEGGSVGSGEEKRDVKGKGKIVLEVGCGTGAFIYPLLERYPSTRFHAFDFSKRAVDLVKAHADYTTSRVHTFVHDLTSPPGSIPLAQQLASAPPEFWSFPLNPSATPESTQLPDVISCVFVLSALPPNAQAAAIRSLVSVLAPNGSLLLRDYALFDQAQLRFHALPSQGYATIPSLLSAPLDASSTSPANPPVSSPLTTSTETDGDGGERGKPWYRRGDGTMTYFFTVEEVTKLINDACEEQTGGRFEMVGEAVVVEREMNNRAEGWGCTRRFVQGSWKKVEKLDR